MPSKRAPTLNYRIIRNTKVLGIKPLPIPIIELFITLISTVIEPRPTPLDTIIAPPRPTPSSAVIAVVYSPLPTVGDAERSRRGGYR